ncbi:hypothetical protein AB0P36_19885 [Streptomyces flavidovirens]
MEVGGVRVLGEIAMGPRSTAAHLQPAGQAQQTGSYLALAAPGQHPPRST